MTLFLVSLLVLALLAVVGSVLVMARDGYRQVPRRPARDTCPDRKWSGTA
ncbi:hypothetical protein [Herbiconiux liangxiaofengii]